MCDWARGLMSHPSYYRAIRDSSLNERNRIGAHMSHHGMPLGGFTDPAAVPHAGELASS